MKKNEANQKWRVFAFNVTTGLPVTGDASNITAKISKDYGTLSDTNDVNPTEQSQGYYLFDLTQAETNCDWISITPISSTANVKVIGDPPSQNVIRLGNGSGSEIVTITTTIASTPTAGVTVNVSTDAAGTNLVASGLISDDNGEVICWLNPGTYYVWRTKAGVTFTNPQSITVTDA